MNKKILFLILLTVVSISPLVALGDATPPANTTLPGMMEQVKQSAITLGGGIVIVGWIIAGILYLIAAGAPDKLTIARKALIACVIGTVLVVLAMGSGPIMGVIRNAFGLPPA